MIIICSLTTLKDFGAYSIWPPPYNISLSHEETFVISELLEKSDVQDVYDEEEMIKKEEMENMKINPPREKFFMVHQHVADSNNNVKDDIDYQSKEKSVEEFNPDREEALPWQGGFVNEHEQFIPEKEMIYFDEDAKALKGNEKQKREDLAKRDSQNYDYMNFKAEYENNVKQEQKSNDTVRYSTVKESESLRDSAKELIAFKETPRNCTAEEMKGIGSAAVECFWMEANKPKTNSRALEKAIRLFIVWIVIYVVVAIPCWCQYGWCCCCFQCKFCKPREQIDEVKRFVAENPVGVYHDEEGNKITYKATNYEKYAQKKLEKEIDRL
ncbi:hypothetical protein NQ317_015480 [Molorchus minor]|uniref:Uncharacterized protein n=1 Tax=Molorchus minor TaxID=1323400 RepID=A0ABQ9JH05_9CUCU|nr:hypothetical protein NQ317_015480 [Molorchus minor]